MPATDARPIPRKNVAYRVTFPILDADGDPVPGAALLDSEVSKDGGAFADCANEATEIAPGSGVYFLDLTLDEMNADTVAVRVQTSTPGAKTTIMVLYPEELGDVRIDPATLASLFATLEGRLTAGRATNLDNLDAAVSTRATPAQVNTEVVDALNVDTYPEPGQGTPSATASLVAKINYLFKAWRNKITNDGSNLRLFADDGTTVDQKAPVSDAAGTFTRGEYTTGP